MHPRKLSRRSLPSLLIATLPLLAACTGDGGGADAAEPWAFPDPGSMYESWQYLGSGQLISAWLPGGAPDWEFDQRSRVGLSVLRGDSMLHMSFVECQPTAPGEELCGETCFYSGDGQCDDGDDDAFSSICDYGTDCLDCGPRPTAMGGDPCNGAGPSGALMLVGISGRFYRDDGLAHAFKAEYNTGPMPSPSATFGGSFDSAENLQAAATAAFDQVLSPDSSQIDGAEATFDESLVATVEDLLGHALTPSDEDMNVRLDWHTCYSTFVYDERCAGAPLVLMDDLEVASDIASRFTETSVEVQYDGEWTTIADARPRTGLECSLSDGQVLCEFDTFSDPLGGSGISMAWQLSTEMLGTSQAYRGTSITFADPGEMAVLVEMRGQGVAGARRRVQAMVTGTQLPGGGSLTVADGGDGDGDDAADGGLETGADAGGDGSDECNTFSDMTPYYGDVQANSFCLGAGLYAACGQDAEAMSYCDLLAALATDGGAACPYC